MASKAADSQAEAARLADSAAAHLWQSYMPLPSARDQLIIERGQGCYVWDVHGKRYLDGLSALFCVNVGHGRAELGQAAAEQAAELGFFHTWGMAHPAAINLAEKIATLTGDGLDRVFFTSGGSESIESAIKLARDYHLANGQERRTKIVSRSHAYHGTTLGALNVTGIAQMQAGFGPLMAGTTIHVPTLDPYRGAPGSDPLASANAIESAITAAGPDTVAAVVLEPVQNNGGCLVPPAGYFQRVRDICDRYGVLLISDEVICAWGRLGEFFGHLRYGYSPDIVATAKGLTSAYAPMGAVIASSRVVAPFLDGTHVYSHGFTFSGHPMCAAVALRNIQIIEDEQLCARVQRNSGDFRAALEKLYDLPVVGDVRGDGYFFALELTADQASKGRFTSGEVAVIGQVLPALLREQGLLIRVDVRLGVPLLTLAPPLTAGPAEFDEMASILRVALEKLITTLR
jgi:adenosylmethionine-8-amino-7-oxononanoate aminotransferase